MKHSPFSAATVAGMLLLVAGPQLGESTKSLRRDHNSKNLSRDLKGQPEAIKQRQELHDYFDDRRYNVKTDTVTETGQVIDWIDPRSQISSYAALPDPPPFVEETEPPIPVPSSKSSKGRKLKRKKHRSSNDYDEEETFELEEQPQAMGPYSTVPTLRRDTVADHLSDDELPHCMDDFLCKYGDETVHERKLAGGKWHHKFAGTREEVENYGASGYISVWSPYVSKTDHREYSLAQVAVHKGKGSSEQRVEAGWQVSRSIYGDPYPHLFVYFTTNGDASRGDGTGGYNQDVKGFVQTSRYIYPGDRLTKVSTVGGTQYAMYVRVEQYKGNWWIRVHDEWIGYFPRELWSPSGLLNGASTIDWGGEVVVYEDRNGYMTETDMGSGVLSDQRFTNAAYVRNIKTLRKDCSCEAEPNLTEYNTVDDSDCYSVKPRFNSGNVWDNYFYFGGPGFSDNCAYVKA